MGYTMKNWLERLSAKNWPSVERASVAASARLRAEQLSPIVRYTPALMLANVFNALALLAAFWGEPCFSRAVIWTAAVILTASYIYLGRRAHALLAPTRRRAGAMIRATTNAFALGACWGALPLFFFQGASPGVQVLIACLSAGMLCGGAFTMASLPAAAICFASPIAVASFIALARAGEKDYLLSAAVLVVYTSVLLKGVLTYAGQLKARVLAQIETEEKAGARMQKLQESSFSAMGGMVSSLAHEVNQPLSAATTYLNLTLRLLRVEAAARNVPPEETVQNALAQVSRASEIVARLRDFIMGAEPERRPVSLHAMIEEACAHYSAAAQKANVKLKLRLDAREDCVRADSVQIGQVLGNLLRNAIEAVEKQPQRIVTISTMTSEGDFVLTRVTDTGTGISEAVKDELFTPFTTTKHAGMGIGLSVSRSIISAHEGKMWAEPAPGEGASFNFTLPLAGKEDRA